MRLFTRDPEVPRVPIAPGQQWFTVAQVAYLMQVTEKEVVECIERGLLLTNTSTGLIHQSEVDRFQHPWKHIWRIDERLNAQQQLVETLKQKINGGEDYNARLNSLDARLARIDYDHDDFNEIYHTLRRQENDIKSLRDSANNAHRKADELNEALRDVEDVVEAQQKVIKKLAKEVKRLVDGHKIHRGR